MIISAVNLISIIALIIILINFRTGYVVALCLRLIIPSFARVIIGPIDLAVYDFLLLGLCGSFIINHGWKSSIGNLGVPRKLKAFVWMSASVDVILILLSSRLTPIDYQLTQFIKKTFVDVGYLLLGYYALPLTNRPLVYRTICYVMIGIGVYGCFCYLTKSNIYSTAFSLIYMDEIKYEVFIDEARGGLEGRVSGTFHHPLMWGQVWNLLFASYLLMRKDLDSRFWDFIIVPLALANIVFSGSRTSIIAAGCTMFFYALSIGFKSAFKKCAVAIIFILIFSLAFHNNDKVSQLYSYIKTGIMFWDKSVSDEADISGSSTDMRMLQLEESVEYAMTNTIGGLGYNSIAYHGSENLGENMHGFESVVFKKLFEQGFIGLFMFFVCYYMLFKTINNNRIIKTDSRLIQGYFASYLISIIVTGIQSTWLLFTILPLFHINTSVKIYRTKS